MINKIHIGYPKTATTYLQKFIYPQLKKHEFIDHAQFVNEGLFDLLWKIDRGIDYDKIKSNFAGRKFFISFEEILGPTFQGAILMDEIPYRLNKAFNQNFKILITVRKQSELIKSIYFQYIQLGGTLYLKNFLGNNVYGHNRLEYEAYDFLKTYEKYADVFGEENVTIIPYELLLLDKHLFKEKLEEFFESETFCFDFSSDENRSLQGFQLKTLRILNHLLLTRVSEKYIIPTSIINQDQLRKRWQKSNFLRIGKSIGEKDQLFLEGLMKSKYHNSNKILDQNLNLNLKDLGYY